MDDIPKFLTELEEFKGNLSDTKKRDLRPKISQLLESSDGIEELQKRLEPKMKITKWDILQLIVSQIQSHLEPPSQSVDRDRLIHLLELISKNSPINSGVCWYALSVMLDANDRNSSQILANFFCSNDSSKCLKYYKEFAFDYIKPDGGLPYLLDLYLQNLTQPKDKGAEDVDYLSDLIQWTSDQLRVKLDQKSISKMKSYFEKLEHLNLKSMDATLILLATQFVGDLRASLKSVLGKLLSEDSKDEQRNIITNNIKKVLGGDVETKPQLVQGRKFIEKKEGAATMPSPTPEDLRKLLTQNSRKLESLIEVKKSRESEHQDIKSKIEEIFEKTQDYYRAIDELEQKKAVKSELRNKNAELREKLDESKIALKRLREEKQQIENSNRRIKIESVDFAKNFCIDMVSTLDLYLDEAKDSSYPTSTDREKFLLEQLRDIHSTLQRLKKQKLEELKNVRILIN